MIDESLVLGANDVIIETLFLEVIFLRRKPQYLHKFSLRIFRGLFIIDDRGILRQITMNDLPVSVFKFFYVWVG
jgi:hypothetical protein